MAKGTFGERLKREREMREVSLEEITAATRIAARYLDALENEVPQNRAPTQPRQAQRLREESRADPGGLLWFILLVGIGFFAWLVSTMVF